MKEAIYTLILVLIVIFIILVVALSSYEVFKDRLKSNERKIVVHQSGNYKVVEIFDVLCKEECIDLIRDAKEKGLDDSMVWSYDGKSGNTLDKSHRKSKQTWFGDEEHEICAKLAMLTEFFTGIPISHQEATQIAMYEPNGRFNEHYDACVDEDPEYCKAMNANSGQRRATLLVYLNDNFEGGETEFVNVGIKIHPKQGKGILFWNTYNDESIIDESKHRGNVVTRGEKWIATKWTHHLEWQGPKVI